MIEVYFAPTPNCWKVTIMLEECALPYRIVPVNLAHGDNFAPGFLSIAPNNRVPAIVDHAPGNGSPPLALFESGAILIHLAEKTGRFIPHDQAGRMATLQWLMWQMAGLGPMLGQHGHFLFYSGKQVPYALERYRREARRLYAVLDAQLARTGAWVAGPFYSIADMACFPWVMTHKAQRFTLDDWPHVQAWFARLRAREALQRGLRAGAELFDPAAPIDPAVRNRLFGLHDPEDGEPDGSDRRTPPAR